MVNITGYTKAGIDKLVAPLFSSISPFTVGGHYYSPVTYFWPDFYNEGQAGKVSKWAKTLAYGNALGYVIMNRSTGDWSAKDNDFLTQAQRAQAAGVKRVLVHSYPPTVSHRSPKMMPLGMVCPTRTSLRANTLCSCALTCAPSTEIFSRAYLGRGNQRLGRPVRTGRLVW